MPAICNGSATSRSLRDRSAACWPTGGAKEALASYQRSLAISQKLLASNPNNVQWLRDVSVAQNKIGDLLAREGRRDEALKAYQAGLAIVEKLVAGNPQVAEWQRDLAISLVRVGDAWPRPIVRRRARAMSAAASSASGSPPPIPAISRRSATCR